MEAHEEASAAREKDLEDWQARLQEQTDQLAIQQRDTDSLQRLQQQHFAQGKNDDLIQMCRVVLCSAMPVVNLSCHLGLPQRDMSCSDLQ